MEWFTIIMTLLSFFTAKKSGMSNTSALVTAGLTGAASYYVSHNTEWGRANLGSLDGVTEADLAPGTPVKDAQGNPIVVGGVPVQSGGGNVWDTLGQWGGYGTAAVIGAAGASTGSGIFSSKNLPWLIAAAAAVVIIAK